MKNKNIKAVVILGCEDYTLLIGAYENVVEAYGDALLCINEQAKNYKGNQISITPLYELECDAGFGMSLCVNGRTESKYVHILTNESCNN